MKIGIYGGTFDPPHIGHMNAVSEAGEQLGIDRLLLVPAGIPPHKEVHSSSAPGEHRFNMLKLAARDIEGAEVSDIELRREGRSYSVDTVTEFRKMYPEDELYMFIGTDMLTTFEEWYRFGDILGMCTVAVFARQEDDRDLIEETAARLREKYGADIRVVRNRAVSISSTELREMLPRRQGAEYLNEEVYAYILKNRLYGARADFDFLRTRAYAMLKPTRVPHVAGCEYEAVRLARRWGADEDDAREAAILHDITKKLDLDEQLILCDKYGIIADNVELQDPKLLHSKTGAETARDLFGISDAVYGAIFWHTTGRADMTALEKIMYLADYIEPTRDFDGLAELRGESFRDLDAAVLLGLRMSLDDLRERKIEPHARTQEAIDWLSNNEGK